MPQVASILCDLCGEPIQIQVGASYLSLSGGQMAFAMPDQAALDAYQDNSNRPECRTVKASGEFVFHNTTCLKNWIDATFAVTP